MMKQHLRMHGQSWAAHFANNWRLSVIAVKAAAFTLGHSFSPRVSGKRATELHNELWDYGRTLSIADISYRLDNHMYVSRDEAVRDFEEHAALYNEQPRLKPFRAVIEEAFAAS